MKKILLAAAVIAVAGTAQAHPITNPGGLCRLNLKICYNDHRQQVPCPAVCEYDGKTHHHVCAVNEGGTVSHVTCPPGMESQGRVVWEGGQSRPWFRPQIYHRLNRGGNIVVVPR